MKNRKKIEQLDEMERSVVAYKIYQNEQNLDALEYCKKTMNKMVVASPLFAAGFGYFLGSVYYSGDLLGKTISTVGIGILGVLCATGMRLFGRNSRELRKLKKECCCGLIKTRDLKKFRKSEFMNGYISAIQAQESVMEKLRNGDLKLAENDDIFGKDFPNDDGNAPQNY